MTGTNTQQGTTSTTTAAVAPKFGGQYGSGNNIFWMGGAPDTNFTKTTSLVPSTPMCIRGLDAVNEMKGYTKRVLEGNSTKFKRDDPNYSLLAFADDALGHMQTYGMDSVFYVKGVDSSGSGGEELFTYHSKYTLEFVKKFVKDKDAAGVYDGFAKSALQESAQWLMNSLDEGLKNSLRHQFLGRPSGPEVWMMIVGEIQADSLRRTTDIAKEFETLTLASFKGENVREYAAKAHDLLVQLEREGQLPKLHLVAILDVFTSCSVMDFKVHFMGRRAAVEKFIRESAGKDPLVVAQMSNLETYATLLEEGKRQYTNLSPKWGPASAAKEAPNAMMAKLTDIEKKVSQVLTPQKAQTAEGAKGKGGKKFKCFRCGKEGHGIKECPENEKDTKDKPKKESSEDDWKFKCPTDGTKEKTVDGAKYFWCGKCRKGKGAWNKTHGSAEHKNGFIKNKKKEGDSGGAGGTGLSANFCQAIVPSSSGWMDNE
jgi:hypothetical protein